MVTAARSENLLKSSPSPSLVHLDKWPTLGSEPASPPREASPPAPRPVSATSSTAAASSGPTEQPSTQSDESYKGSSSGKKTAWAKLDVPIRYPPPPSVAARSRAKSSGKRESPDHTDQVDTKKEKSAADSSATATASTTSAPASLQPPSAASHSSKPRAKGSRSAGKASSRGASGPSPVPGPRSRSGSIISNASNVSAKSGTNNAGPAPQEATAEVPTTVQVVQPYAGVRGGNGAPRGGAGRDRPRGGASRGRHGGRPMNSVRPHYSGYAGYPVNNGAFVQQPGVPPIIPVYGQQAYVQQFANGGIVDPDLVDFDTLKWWIRSQM